MFVFTKQRYKTVKRELADVVAFYAEDKYVMVHFTNGDTQFFYALSSGESEPYRLRNVPVRSVPTIKGCFAFLKKYDYSNFIQVSRSHIVNLATVNEIESFKHEKSGALGKALCCSTGHKAVISRRNHKAVTQTFLSGEAV